MRRQENYYRIVGDTTQLCIVQTDGTRQRFTIPQQYLSEIKLFHWSFRGKNGVFNEFNVSLGAFLAERYGYSGTNWRRISVNSDSYLPDNFTKKLAVHGSDVPNWKPIAPAPENLRPREALQQKFYSHKRVLSKHKCETLQIDIMYNQKVIGTVSIEVNTYIRHLVPTQGKLIDNAICLLDGTPLAKHIAIHAGLLSETVERVTEALLRRDNYFDYRVDPITLCFVATTKTHWRFHRVDIEGTNCLVIEHRQCPKDVAEYRIDGVVPEYIIQGTWRSSFCLIDAATEEALLKVCPDKRVFFNVRKNEFFVIDAGDGTWLAMKKLAARANGYSVDETYVAPRMTKGYETALKEALASEQFGIADKRRARYENATGEEAKTNNKMYTNPKHYLYRHIRAEKSLFVGALYGGIGAWCKDLRATSLILKQE